MYVNVSLSEMRKFVKAVSIPDDKLRTVLFAGENESEQAKYGTCLLKGRFGYLTIYKYNQLSYWATLEGIKIQATGQVSHWWARYGRASKGPAYQQAKIRPAIYSMVCANILAFFSLSLRERGGGVQASLMHLCFINQARS